MSCYSNKEGAFSSIANTYACCGARVHPGSPPGQAADKYCGTYHPNMVNPMVTSIEGFCHGRKSSSDYSALANTYSCCGGVQTTRQLEINSMNS